MFNKLATYVDKKSKLSYVYYGFDVDGFFVVYMACNICNSYVRYPWLTTIQQHHISI